MAILSKIRKRSFVLIVVIALALFSFVLSDLIQNGSFGNSGRYAGSINGEDLLGQEFQYKVAQAEQQGMSNAQASNAVWEQEVRRVILSEQFEKLGLRVSNKQLINVMKDNPNFANSPQFLNEAGKFDENKFREFVKTMLASPNSDQKRQWLAYEVDVERSFKEQMYFSMIKSGLQTTQAEAKLSYEDENNKVDFDYVMLAYSTINDDEAKVTDDDIMAYIKKNPKKYKSDKTANLDLVFIENKPSKADEEAMKKSVEGFLNGKVEFNAQTSKNDTLPSFIKATNVAEYIAKNSDLPYDSTYVAKKDLPLEYQEQLFNLAAGQVFGPYVDNGYQKLSKVTGRKANTSAKASHILIAYKGAMRADAAITRTKEEAQAKATELLAQAIANPSGFSGLAMTNSDDPGSKQNGGEYDNIMPNQMTKAFNDFVFNSPIGKIGVVETEFGYHVIKVSDRYSSVQLATVAVKVEPSEETSNQNFNKASKFEEDANTKDFAEVAKAAGLVVTPANSIKTTDEMLPVVGAQRGVVLWAFNKDTDINDVKRFDTPQGYVIAKLKSINDTGLMSVETAKPMVESLIRNEKKAELIRKKMTGKTVEEVSKSSKATGVSATGVAMNNALVPNVGPEPKVVGKAFGLANGKTSDLIDGNAGVFMIKTKNITKAPAVTNYTNYVNQGNSQLKGGSYRAVEALKEKSEIEDLRVQ